VMLLNRRPKVLLIYPGSKSAGAVYPTGLLYIALSLRKINIDVSIFHMGIDDISSIRLENYLFVGISMLTGDLIKNGLYLAKIIRNYNNHIPIVIGGVHPSLLPEESLQNELVDFVVIGEGDKTIQELATCLLNNSDISGIKGLGYKDSNKKVIINAQREFLDMNELDFDLPYELLSFFSKKTSVIVHTSRGCPYRCSFCYNPVVNKRKYRCKSAERVIDEIEHLHKKYRIDYFSFASEDEFFIYPQRVYEILKFILQRDIKIRWTAFCRFNTFIQAYDKFGQDFIDTIKKSGCLYLSFGAESGSQRLLDDIIHKDIKIEQITRTIEILKNANIPHRVSFICCFPTETQTDLNATFDVIDKITLNNPLITLGLFKLIPFPGTGIYDLLKKEYNLKTPSSLEEWGNYNLSGNAPLDDISWLPEKHVKMCHNLTLIAKYPFHKDVKSFKEYKEFISSIDSSHWPGYIDYIMVKIQKWRYVNKKFDLMIEFPIHELFVKFRVFLGRYLLFKYLPKSVYDKLVKRFWRKNKFPPV